MPLKLITPPVGEPLSLPEVKQHLRVETSDEDDLINSLLKAAREYCEGRQSRFYMTQTWEKYLDNWPLKNYIELVPGLQGVTSVKYYDAAGVEYTFDAANYEVDPVNIVGRFVLAPGKSWPSVSLRAANGICVQFTCGYGEASDVPETVKLAMKLIIGHWYEHREAVLTGSISKEIDFAVTALLGVEQVMSI